MIVRKSGFKDLPVIEKIAEECIKKMQSQKLDFWDEHYPNKNQFLKDFSDGSLFSICTAEKIVGSVCISNENNREYSEENWRYDNFMVIRRLMIDPAFQRQGFARKAMILAEEEILRLGKSSVRLAVYIENSSAHKLYENMRYTLRGITTLAKGLSFLYEKQLLPKRNLNKKS